VGQNRIPPSVPLLVPRIAKLSLVLVALAAPLATVFGGLVAGRGEASSTGRDALESGRPVVLAFGGDVHFEGVLKAKLAANASRVLAPIQPLFDDADLAVVNLETAVTGGGVPAVKKFVFSTPPSAFAALRGGGVDVASMANNHGMDFGESGLRDSLSAAKRYRFPVIGIGLDGRQAYRPFRRTINGQRIAVIGATQVLDDELISAWTAGPNKPGLASAKEVPRLLREVRAARRTSDTVVVFLHWGVELEKCPTADQRMLSKQLVAAGADVVVGGHAHRLQGAGRMGNALVGYGLGNFAWYGTSELSTQTGVLFVTVTGRKVNSYRWAPAQIVDGVPRPSTGAERRQELASWRSLRACTGLKP
jgi:poly-gamma-glutamate capsule biosynthesis protein CapA/YwtB (metallophosphatase superfamily)